MEKELTNAAHKIAAAAAILGMVVPKLLQVSFQNKTAPTKTS
ncbi:hypothetical protein [Anaplasma platys]|nr:hypothetical protein [Anaplasma platys]